MVEMKLISLNVWGGRVFEDLMQFFEKEKDGIDIFCLQEVLQPQPKEAEEEAKAAKEEYQKSGRKQIWNLYSEIGNRLSEFNGFVSEPYSSDKERLATFIRKGIDVKVEVVPVYKRLPLTLYGMDFWVGCIMQHITVNTNAKSYDIANVHGLWQGVSKEDTSERINQSNVINGLLSKFGGSRVLCGDFNLNPDTESVKILEKSMRNLVRENKITATRSSLTPERKGRFADYAFVSDKIKVKNFKVLNELVSDHLPLYLEFE